MKRLIVLFIALVSAVVMIASGCNEKSNSSSDKPTKKASSSQTAQTSESTEKATTESSTETAAATKPTTETTQAKTEETTTEATTVAVKSALTGRKWNCSEAYKNGKKIKIQDQYGSIINQTGAYLEFSDDNTFKCIMGFEGCEGTYKISSQQVTVTKTVLYSATKEKSVSQTETLIIDEDYESITMTLNGITLVFI